VPVDKQNNADIIIYAGLFLLSLAVVFPSSYNPVSFTRMHVDSSVYITIAQGITRGQLPYMDFVDNKGPLTYLLSVPGLMLGRLAGVWITELILMFVSVIFAYKTALFFSNNKLLALLGTVCGFIELYSFFGVSAGTEEYSLPFLMISLYLFTKYYFSPERDIGLTELLILGACFACAVLIRLNMFPLWAGFCVIIFIESIIKRRFVPLVKYVLGFCAGIIIIAVPVFLYLKLNGILNDFFDQVIYGGAAKGFSDASSIKQTAKNFFVVFGRGYSFLPLVMGVFWLITNWTCSETEVSEQVYHKKNDFSFYLGYTVSYILMLLFLSFSGGGSHYNLVLIPFFIPAFTFFVKLVYSAFSGVKKRNIALVLFLCVFFLEYLAKWLDDLAEMFYSDSGAQLIRAGKMIDENTMPGDKIISLGSGYIYPFTKREAASKYIYQGAGIDQIFPGAREKFLSDIFGNKPAIIAVFSADDLRYDYLPDWYAPVYKLIDEDYRLLSDENGYFLFIRK
jgi:hypothetical protein